MADFGESNFGQSILVLCCVVGVVGVGCWVLGVGVGVGVGVVVGVVDPPVLPCAGPPFAGPPYAGPPKNFALFFPSLPSLPIFALFVSLSGCLLVEFWLCLKRRSPQICAFGVLWLSCAPVAPKPPGFHTTVREPKRAHSAFVAIGLSSIGLSSIGLSSMGLSSIWPE